MSNQRIEYEFDNARFMHDVRDAYGKNASLREIADRTGISASTWSRIDNGGAVDMATFMQVCAWAELQPGDYFKRVVWERKDG